MKAFIVLCLSSAFQFTFSQNFLYMNSGEKVEYKSIEVTGENIIIKTPQKKTVTISIEDVWGTCFAQLLRVTSNEYESFSKPQLISYDLDGEIKVVSYTTFTSTGPNGAAAPKVNYFAIKDSIIYSLQNTTFFNGNKKRHEVMKALLGGSQEFQSILNDSTYKFNSSNMLEMIEQYNLNTFKTSTYINPTSVFLYSPKVSNSGTSIEVTINEKSLGIISKSGVMPVQLDFKKPSKVCVKTG